VLLRIRHMDQIGNAPFDIRTSNGFPRTDFVGSSDELVTQSEADLALCSFLVFYTQDAAQLDRLFRASKLFREKWNETNQQRALSKQGAFAGLFQSSNFTPRI